MKRGDVRAVCATLKATRVDSCDTRGRGAGAGWRVRAQMRGPRSARCWRRRGKAVCASSVYVFSFAWPHRRLHTGTHQTRGTRSPLGVGRAFCGVGAQGKKK